MSSFDEYRKKLKDKYGLKNDTKSEEEKTTKSSGGSAGNTSKPASSGTNKTTVKTSGSSSFDSYREKLRSKYLTDKVDSDGVTKWFNDAHSAMSEMENYNKANADKYDADYGGDAGKRVDYLLNSSKDVYNYIQNHSDEFDNADELKEMFNQYQSALLKFDKANYDTRRYYSSFGSEEGYKNYLASVDYGNKSAEELEAYKGSIVDDVQQHEYAGFYVNALKEGKSDEWIRKNMPEYAQAYDYIVDKYDIDTEVYPPAYIGEIIYEKTMSLPKTEKNPVLYYDQHGAVTLDNLITVKKTEGKIAAIQADNTLKTSYDELMTYNQDIGEMEAAMAALSAKDEGATVYPEDMEAYNYIINKYGIDPTGHTNASIKQVIYETYLQLIDGSYSGQQKHKSILSGNGYDWDELLYYHDWNKDRERQLELKKSYEMVAEDYPTLATVANLFTGPIQAVEFAGDVLERAKYAGKGEYSAYGLDNIYDNNANAFSGTVSGTVTENIKNEVMDKTGSEFWSDLAGTAYSGVTSAVQSYVTQAMLGPVGGSLILASQSASSAYIDGIKNGQTTEQAMAVGVISGVAEYFTEKITWEKLIEIDTSWDTTSVFTFLKSLFKNSSNVFMQGLYEGGEEVISSLANTIADEVIAQDKSAIATAIRQYKMQGLSDTDAKKQATQDWWTQLLDAAIGGFIGGASAGGVVTAAQTGMAGATGIINNSRENKWYKSKYDLPSLIDEALEIDPENKLAKKIKEKVSSGKNVSGSQIKSLVQSNMERIKQQSTETAEVGDNEIVTTLEEASKKYGAQAQAMVHTYHKDQDISKYDTAYKHAYNMGKNGVSLDYAMKSESTSYLTETQRELAYNAGKAAADFGKEKEVSDMGKAEYTDPKTEETKAVKVQGVASINNGEMMLKLDNGETVKASDVSFSSKGEALLYSTVLDMGVDTEAAERIIGGYKASGNISMHDYALGIKKAYDYGYAGIDPSQWKKSDFTHKLSDETKSFAYELGRNAVEAKTNAKQKGTSEKVTEAKKKGPVKAKAGKVIAEDGVDVTEKGEIDTEGLSELQKKSLIGIKGLASVSPINFHIFKSQIVDGKYVATINGKVVEGSPNGLYYVGTNDIWIDLNAGNFGAGTMLWTAGHEISHYIRERAAASWKAMADLVISEFSKRQDISVTDMLDKQITKIKEREALSNNTEPKSEAEILDEAYEDLISDALSEMLEDGSVVEFLAEVKQQDKSLWQTIKDAIADLLKRWGEIIGVYKNQRVDTREAEALRSMEETFKKLQKMYAEAFAEANAVEEAIGDTLGVRSLEDFLEAKNTNGEQLFQYRAMEADEATYRDMLRKWGKMSDVQINNLFATVDKAMEIIKDNLEVLDYAWEADIDDRAFSPVKPNSDSLYKVSLDFSTLCRKRILQQTIIAELQAALEKPLTREEGIAIRDALMALQEEGRKIEVACALCYVESARMKSPEQIKKFLNNRENVLRDFFASKSGGDIKGKIKQAELDMRAKLGVELDASLKSLDKKTADAIRQAKRDAKASYAPTKAEQELIEVAKAMTVSDFTSPEGLENLAKNYPELFDAYTSYVRNATKSKGIENDTWWRAGDSSRIGDVLIANMNRENGLRSQSWSDFQVIHILDYIAATIELSTRNAKEQAYTKVPDYVELMGQTGVMINMSLIPTSKFDGTLQYDEVEGIAYKRALELREKYPATAGTICIGVDNRQIQMLLADINIDYVIPYHRSGMAAAIRKLMHIPTWSEYEKYQGETELSDADAKKNAEKYGVKLLDKSDPNYQKHTNFSEWFDLEVAKQIAKMENANPSDKAKQKAYGVMYGGYMAMQDAANNYLKLCAERGLSPKFSHEKADFTVEDNYWKLLIDRKMVNNATGEIIEQQTIQPIFDEGEVLRILNDELERYPSVKADQDYAVRKVTENFLSGNIKSGMSAEAIAKVMKKPVDNVTNVNIEAAAEDVKVQDKPAAKYSERITADMSDAERADVLKKKNITNTPTVINIPNEILQKLESVSSWDDINKLFGSEKRTLIQKIASEFGVFKGYKNEDINISFEFSNNNYRESYGKQKRDFENFAKMFSVFDSVVENAIGIEIHKREDYKPDATLKNVYVLISAFEDGDFIVPVKLEVKEFKDKQNTLYVAISLQTIKKTEVSKQGTTENGVAQGSRSVTINVADLMRKVNPLDTNFTKYFPKELLTDEQRKRLEPVAKHSDRNSNGKMLSKGQQEYFKDSKVRDADGNLRVVYHGTPNGTFTEFKMTEGSHSSLMAQYGAGFYFDTDRKAAERYTSAVNKTGGVSHRKVYEAYLNITNPLEITDTSHVVTKEQFAEVVRQGNYEWFFTNGMPNELRNWLGKSKAEIQQMPKDEIVNHWVDMVYERATFDSDLLSSMVKAFKGRAVVEAMREVFGKDGIRVNDRYGEMWIAWDANQIKETNNLNPTSNLDIRYSERNKASSKVSDGNYSVSDIKEMFDAWNTDPDLTKLAERVFAKLEAVIAKQRSYSFANGYTIRFANEEDINRYSYSGTPEGLFSGDTTSRLYGITYNSDKFNSGKLTEQRKATILLHEAIHACTVNAIMAAERSIPKYVDTLSFEPKEYWGEDVKAGLSLIKIFEQVRTAGESSEYGQRDAYEMVAELANPDFRQFLKKQSLWSRVVDAIKRIFGIESKNALDATSSALERILNEGVNASSNTNARYSERSTDSNRSLLANALETTVQNDLEAQKLKVYKEKISLIDAEQQKLAEINAEIRELSFAKGKRDTERLKALRFDAVQTANRINTYDRQLLNLESTKVLKAVLEREKGLAMKRQKQKNAEVQKAYREKIIETRDKQEAVKKLQKLLLDTSKWISYPKKEDVKCPDILRGPYAEFLESIDLSSKRLLTGGKATLNDQKIANAMNSLATAIEQIKAAQNPTADTKDISPEALDAGYLDLPVNFVINLRKKAEDITRLMVPGDFVVGRMSAEDVKQISKLIKTLNHSIKEMSTMYSNLRFARVEEAGVHTIDFLDDIGKAKSTNAVSDFVSWENGMPYYVFKRFGEAGESIFEELMDAQDKLAYLADEIFKFKDKTWTDKEANAWGKDTHTIKLPSGNEITLTTADAMGIYCLSRREQAVPHLLGGGIRVIGVTKGAKKASDSRSTLTVEDLNTIISSLSDKQKSVAEAIQEFMSSTCSEWGNEISMKRFLTREFREKYYYPIESSDENLPVKDKMAQQADLYRLLNISATKPLTEGANNAVVIRNIFEVFTNHTSDMAKLNAYGMALLDYMKWVNYREKTTTDEKQIVTRGVRQSMNSTYGDKAFSYVLNLIKDVNGRYNDGGDHAWLMKMTRAAKTAAVGNSLRVAALQVTSYPRAGYVLSQKSLTLGLTKKPQIKKAQKYCGVALWKSFGFYDTNISRSIEDQIKGTTDIKQKLIEWSLKGAELGDALTWGLLWNACEYEVASTKKYKVGTEEFNQAVGKKLREVVYATQVVDSTLTRSQIMRNKSGLTQGATAFMSEPTLSANILMDAGFQFNLEKRRTGSVKSAWKKAGKQIGRAVAIYSIGQLTAATIEALFDAYRDDDDDEEFKEKFTEAFKKNVITDLMPFNKIPIISDLVEFVLSRFDIGYFSSDNLSTTWLSQAATAYDAWAEIIEEKRGGEETSKTVYNAIYNTVRALSSMTGVAGSGLMREAIVFWNNTAGAYDSTLKVKTYENSKTQNGQLLYEAIIKGDKRQAESLKAQFENEDEVSKALVKALRENDPRIIEAAEARLSGDMTLYLQIAKAIKAEGNFHQDIIVYAINSEMNALKRDDGEASSGFRSKPTFTNADYYNAAVNGDAADVKAVKDYLIESGKTESQIQSSFNSSVKDAYEEGEITVMSAVSLMTTYGGKTSDEANLSVKYMDFKTEYPEYADGITETKFSNYYEPISDYGGYSLEDWGISLSTYAEYCVQSAECKGVDANGDGKTDSGSKKAEILEVINALPLTYEQKDALYYLNGWSAKTIYEAPWH